MVKATSRRRSHRLMAAEPASQYPWRPLLGQVRCGGKTGHKYLPHPCFTCVDNCVFTTPAFLDPAANVRDQENTIHGGHAEQRDESNRGGDAGVEARNVKSQNSAADRKGNTGECD